MSTLPRVIVTPFIIYSCVMFVMCSPISLPPFESWNITKSSQVTYHRAQEAAGWHEFDSSGPFLFLVDTRCNE